MSMDWKGLYKRFKQWQIDPFTYRLLSEETHHCYNCGQEFQGNYCPMCSQRAGQKKVDWSTVRHNVMEIWGVGNRSMPYSLWQLLWRPGYFISDYINGRRQVSFPPVKMLIIVSIIVLLIDHFIGSDEFNVQADDNNFFLNDILAWALKNLGWATLIVNSFLILPTYINFRHSPRNTAHSLPSGFFIQVFISTMMLVFALLDDIGILLVPFYFYFTYRQLFGYGAWGTIWRLCVCFFEGLVLIVVPLVLYIIYYDGKYNVKNITRVMVLCIIVAFTLLLTFFISRSVSRKGVALTPAPEDVTQQVDNSESSEASDDR